MKLEELSKTICDVNYLKLHRLNGNNEVYTSSKERIFKEAKERGILSEVRTCMVVKRSLSPLDLINH